MGSKKKYLTDEERKQAKREANKRYRINNPNKDKEYYRNNKEKFQKYQQENKERIKRNRIITARKKGVKEKVVRTKEEKKEYYRKYAEIQRRLRGASVRTKHKSDEDRINYIKQKKKEYAEINRDKIRKYHKVWSLNNKQKRKDSYLRNKEKVLASCKVWANLNIDKIRLIKKRWRDKECTKEMQRNYARNRLERKKANGEKLNIPNGFEFRIKEKFNHKCFNCGSQDRLELDHHYPLSLGNSLSENNCVLLCKSCNSSKGSKLPEDFYSPEQLAILKNEYGIQESDGKNIQPSLFDFLDDKAA